MVEGSKCIPNKDVGYMSRYLLNIKGDDLFR